MEKHVIFLYPLHPVIQELKDILEKDGGYDINEIDDVNEYKQLVGVIGQSVTLTSDAKKIVQSLEAQNNLIKNNISKIIILGKTQNYKTEIAQLRVIGVQEILPDNTNVKSVQFKLNLFLKGFEQSEAKKIKDKEQEDKKSKKIISKKSFSVLVDNEDKDKIVHGHVSKSLFEDDADSDNKKVKNNYTPLVVNSEEITKVKAKESSPIVESSADSSTPLNTPLRLAAAKEEAKIARKKELEEAAALIKKHREGLKLTEDEENKVRKQLRVNPESHSVTGSAIKDEDKDYERKKYNEFHVDEEQSRDAHGKGQLADENSIVKSRSSLRLESEKDKRKHYDPFRVSSERDSDEKSVAPIELNEVVEDVDYGVDEDSDSKKGVYLKASDNITEEIPKDESEEIFLTYPDFYYPPSGVSTFIPLLVEVLHSRPFNQDKFMQFICFMFFKKLGGQLTYILEREGKYELLASTHLLTNKNWEFQKNYSDKKMNDLGSINVPTWSDNTFQDKVLEFYFPFYFNKSRLGLAHAVFDAHQINNLQEAMEVELLIVMARAIYLKEHRL